MFTPYEFISRECGNQDEFFNESFNELSSNIRMYIPLFGIERIITGLYYTRSNGISFIVLTHQNNIYTM
jgi:hypothetical protein